MVGFAVWIVRSIARPVTSMVKAMHAVVAGDLEAPIPYADRSDEIGQMAGAAEAFRQASFENRRLEQEASQARGRGEAERRDIQASAEAAAQRRLLDTTAVLAAGLNGLASGDLTTRLDVPLPPEYEQLRLDLNQAILQLGTTISGVAQVADQIDAGSRHINRSSDDLSSRTERQAASLEQTAAALDEITAAARKASDTALSARDLVAATRQDAESSSVVVRQAVEAMNDIERSAREIGQIISVIDEIAFQTNLLALNAGVEAARAGDAGRGFAVVASEVRALAQRSADAAKEIKGLILASSDQVSRGVDLVGRVEAVLSTIVAQVGRIDGGIAEMASSGHEQSSALEQVNIAINQLDQTTQQNAAMVEETTAATHALHGEAETLSELIRRFKITQAGRSDAFTPRVAPAPARGTTPRHQMRTIGQSAIPAELASPGSWEEF
jgi:methyl-accepting chemotaxis protein